MGIHKPNRASRKPLGGRKFTEDHARAEILAEQFTPSSDFDRFEAITILRRIAHRLPERGGARWTQALLTHIEFLVGHTSARDWQDGRPVLRGAAAGRVWDAQRRLKKSRAVDALHAFLATLEPPVGVPEGDGAADRPAGEPVKAAETLLNDENIHPTGRIDRTPGTDPSIAHRIQTESLVKDTGNPDGGAIRRRSSRPDGAYGRDGDGGRGNGVPERRTARHMAPNEVQDMARDADGPSGRPEPARRVGRTPPPLRTGIRDEIPIGQVMAAMPEDIRGRLNRISQDAPDWGALMLVADGLAPEIGISPSAWAEACRLMGPDTAALAVLIIAAKRRRGLVWQPGGYLRGMTRKWAGGALNLRPALFGLAER